MAPPPPPPKPIRQHVKTTEESATTINNNRVLDREEVEKNSDLVAVIESLRRKKNESSTNDTSTTSTAPDKIKLYENYETTAEEQSSEEPIITPMKPRIPRGDSPMKTTNHQNSTVMQSIHRRVASLDSSIGSSQKSNFDTAFQRPDHDLLKIRTVRRILGSSVSFYLKIETILIFEFQQLINSSLCVHR
jgi:effector-binding domain-containing protein